MQDDLRADLLNQVLSDRHPLPDGLEDAELDALVELGAELDHLGAHIAMIEHADSAFNPAFAHSLAARLLSEHPAAASATAEHEQIAKGSVVAPVVRHARRITRHVIVLGVVVLGLIAAAIAGIINSSHPVSVATTAGKVSPTAQGPQIFSAAAPKDTPRHAAVPNRTTPSFGSKAAATPSAKVHKNTSKGSQAAGTPTVPAPRNGAMRTAPAQGDAVQLTVYRLPAVLPALPASAPVYVLRYQTLSASTVASIAATFHGLRLDVPSGRYRAPGGDALSVTRQTGEILYTRPDAGANGAGKPKITPAQATNLALAWLAAHAMLPKGVSARDASTQYLHGKVIVQFAPSTRFPLNADQTAVDLTVELDAGGHVFYAHRLWPTLQGAGTARLRSPHSIVTSDTGAASPGSVQGATSTPQR
ncbi:MAG: hypothetical protein JWO42_2001 [Chloroflexi bacterium]|nr:hypothetical protein [Chloroflexota bacterium]